MGMIATRALPAPTCPRCGQRIGYNQRSKVIRKSGRPLGWRHESCRK